MLDKRQSELWNALGYGDQWVLRDEIADLQKKASAEKIPAPKCESKNLTSDSPTPSPSITKTPKQESPPVQASVKEESSKIRTATRSTRRSTSTLGGSKPGLFKPAISSRHVDVQDARAAKRIEFIRNADWKTLQQAVQDCTVCDIGKNRLNAVFGQGQPPCDVLLIGEGPGRIEDERGEIFVGQSGQLLDKILNHLKIKRGEDVAILNTIKCRPPENANPSEPETAACRPFLERQIELLDPKLIVVMGKPALKWVLRKDVPVKTQRGRVQEVEVAGKKRKVIVTFHPSYLLRTPIDKGKAWLDWLLVIDTMRKLKNDGQSV